MEGVLNRVSRHDRHGEMMEVYGRAGRGTEVFMKTADLLDGYIRMRFSQTLLLQEAGLSHGGAALLPHTARAISTSGTSRRRFVSATSTSHQQREGFGGKVVSFLLPVMS